LIRIGLHCGYKARAASRSLHLVIPVVETRKLFTTFVLS